MHACVVVWKELEDLEFEGAYYPPKMMSGRVKKEENSTVPGLVWTHVATEGRRGLDTDSKASNDEFVSGRAVVVLKCGKWCSDDE